MTIEKRDNKKPLHPQWDEKALTFRGSTHIPHIS